MGNLFVGIGQMSLMMRHARGLKDKRNVLKSIEHKLKNLGFSVTECEFQENPKQSVVGYSYVGHDATSVERALDEAETLFLGTEVLRTERDVFDYSDLKHDEFENWDDPHHDP